MSYTASTTVTIGLGWVRLLLEEMYVGMEFKPTGEDEYGYYLTCRDTKRVCEEIEWSLEHMKLDAGILVRLGVLHRVFSEHWNEYIGAKMRACPYPGGKARKRYLYAACAEYRFVFSQ